MNKPSYEELEKSIQIVIGLSFETLAMIQEEIKKVYTNPIEEQNKPILDNLMNIMYLLNNLSHPLYKISKYMLKESEWPNVDFLIKLHKGAILEKRLDLCWCDICADIKKEIEIKVE